MVFFFIIVINHTKTHFTGLLLFSFHLLYTQQLIHPWGHKGRWDVVAALEAPGLRRPERPTVQVHMEGSGQMAMDQKWRQGTDPLGGDSSTLGRSENHLTQNSSTRTSHKEKGLDRTVGKPILQQGAVD